MGLIKAIARKYVAFIRAETEKHRRAHDGVFYCPNCGSSTFVFVTNPVHSVNRIGQARTKAMVKCKTDCGLRMVWVSDDYGKTWDPYAPSN